MADGPNPTCPVDDKSRKAPSQAAQKRPWSQKVASYIWSPKASGDDGNELNTNRAVSSIPRASPSASNPPSACPVANNAEVESGSGPDGRWVYPSEKMFFEAMRRKGYDPRALDMKTVVPIHNAVNERAWARICQWEAPYLKQSTCVSTMMIDCPGPKLESFSNKNDCLTPKARLNSLLGYAPPFDRHDWVIDRCGTRVEYVIDFYSGRSDGKKPGPSFYLDVRPKLNSWEGVKMRALGLVYMT
ncbi:hypothetical protein L249_1238 [Ophiocordyceps polyrhachis-furcata BCC 54312]|uniref:Holocytochrome c-type synthase n=1 Tax=Ophiocordyceps polyrhachis-furcata BCC 54312 TaxID=1330021 RepID=A0A367LDZ4_9HYPO|nr:hypothetical protein L249_1238 [Ophiocordyceps polyrhachis-furcata BCC 54312]